MAAVEAEATDSSLQVGDATHELLSSSFFRSLVTADCQCWWSLAHEVLPAVRHCLARGFWAARTANLATFVRVTEQTSRSGPDV